MENSVQQMGSKMNAFYKKKVVWIPLVAFFSLVLLVAIFAGDSNNKSSTQHLAKGEEGILNTNNDPNNCTGEASVAFSEEAMDALTKAANAKDEYGYSEIFSKGQATIVPNCTKVKAIDQSIAKTKIRLVDKPEIAGWVPYEWAISVK